MRGAFEASLSRADWAFVSRPHESLGRRFTFRSNDQEVGGFLAHAYAPAVAEGADQGSVISIVKKSDETGAAVYLDDRFIHAGKHGVGVLNWVSHTVNQLITQQRTERLILHAGAVAWEGGSIILPGAMESGKSTLVTALLRSGLSYISDEAVAWDADEQQITGFPKPITLDPGSWALFADLLPLLEAALSPVYFYHQWQVPAPWLGAIYESARPQMVVFPQYVEGVATFFESLRPADALRRLDACRFPSSLPRPVQLRQLANLIEHSRCYSLRYSDLSEGVRLIRAESLEGPSNQAPSSLTD